MTTWDDNSEFKDMHKAFLLLGFTEKQREEVYTLLSFGLTCGNVEFVENDKSEAAVESTDELEKASRLIEVSVVLTIVHCGVPSVCVTFAECPPPGYRGAAREGFDEQNDGRWCH